MEKEEAKLTKRRGRGKKAAEASKQGETKPGPNKKRAGSKKAEASEPKAPKRTRSSKLLKLDAAEGKAADRKLTKGSSVASLPADEVKPDGASKPCKSNAKASKAWEKVQQSLYDLKFDSLPDLPLPDAKQFTKQRLNPTTSS